MIRNDRRTRMRLMAGLAVSCTLALAACSSSTSSSAAAGSTATSSSTAAASSGKVTLVVYSAQGYDSAMTKAFTAATGIPVKLDDNSTGPLLTQIEASKNNPKWGLLWVDGPTAFAGLDDQHLLVRGFEPDVAWDALGKEAVPKDGSYVPTGITLTEALVYTSKVVTDPPSTWQELLQPQWKDAVGMNTPSQSGPTFPFIAGMMNYLGGTDGVDKGEKYFQELKANGLVVHTTNGPTLQALTSGQIKLALVQSSAGIGAKHTDPNLAVKYLPPITLLPSAIGIDGKATTTEQAEAKEFVKYVLSKTGQQVMRSGTPTGDSLYYPVIDGVQPLKTLPSLASVKTQNITPYVWGPREDSVNTWFVTNITK
jgi:iron(III) transport system substrate-binding protein